MENKTKMADAGSPKVSVIVPVYKAEKYLRKCVDSILAQTFRDFEVILVDDGSPDGSGEICDEYARRDARVRVIHKANGGVSSARQAGLDAARGEYTIHADPDDWVEPNMLEELYAKAKAEDADMVICDFYYEYSPTRITVCRQRLKDRHPETVIAQLFRMEVTGCVWNKLIRTSLFRENSISFPKGINIGEDYSVVVALLLVAQKITSVDLPLYHYIRNQGSMTKRKSEDLLMQRTAFVELVEEQVAGHDKLLADLPYFRLMVKCDILVSHPSPKFYKNLYPETTRYISTSNYNWVVKLCLYAGSVSSHLGYFLYRCARMFK